jgi:hypothetical protein
MISFFRGFFCGGTRGTGWRGSCWVAVVEVVVSRSIGLLALVRLEKDLITQVA